MSFVLGTGRLFFFFFFFLHSQGEMIIVLVCFAQLIQGPPSTLGFNALKWGLESFQHCISHALFFALLAI